MTEGAAAHVDASGSPNPRATVRIGSLDGLRGLAALIVVVYHCLLITPTIWDQIAGRRVQNLTQWILAYTPLRIVWAGGEAVWIFFILSGFVLVRPYLEGRSLVVGRYYLRRALRLYLPFFGSFALAVALRAIQSTPTGGRNGWLFVHQLPTASSDAIRTLFLFGGDTTTYNDVWWSLRWEVWFSALLPVVIPLARRFRRRGLPLALACLAIAGLSNFAASSFHIVRFGHENPFLYLPMFGLGVSLAMAEERVRSLIGGRPSKQIWVAGAVCSAAMTSTAALLVVFQRVGMSISASWALAGPIGIAGAVGLVALALNGAGLRDVLASRRMTWLGTRSYTLYLIHEPILVTFALAFGLDTLTCWWIPFGLAVSILATFLVFPIIERPALRLAAAIRPRR